MPSLWRAAITLNSTTTPKSRLLLFWSLKNKFLCQEDFKVVLPSLQASSTSLASLPSLQASSMSLASLPNLMSHGTSTNGLQLTDLSPHSLCSHSWKISVLIRWGSPWCFSTMLETTAPLGSFRSWTPNSLYLTPICSGMLIFTCDLVGKASSSFKVGGRSILSWDIFNTSITLIAATFSFWDKFR